MEIRTVLFFSELLEKESFSSHWLWSCKDVSLDKLAAKTLMLRGKVEPIIHIQKVGKM